jgi:hypothetical protein
MSGLQSSILIANSFRDKTTPKAANVAHVNKQRLGNHRHAVTAVFLLLAGFASSSKFATSVLTSKKDYILVWVTGES